MWATASKGGHKAWRRGHLSTENANMYLFKKKKATYRASANEHFYWHLWAAFELRALRAI